jgi:3'-5' exonuclease
MRYLAKLKSLSQGSAKSAKSLSAKFEILKEGSAKSAKSPAVDLPFRFLATLTEEDRTDIREGRVAIEHVLGAFYSWLCRVHPGTSVDKQNGINGTAKERLVDTVPSVEIVYTPFQKASYKYITSPSELQAELPAVLASPFVAVDTETTGLCPHKDKLRLVQLAVPEKPVLVIDTWRVPVEALAPLFDGGRTLVLQNAKFDLKFFAKAGLWLPSGKGLFDTMLAAQLLEAGTNEGLLSACPLEKLCSRYLNQTLDKSMQRSDWSGLLVDEQLHTQQPMLPYCFPCTMFLRRSWRERSFGAC